MDYTQLALVLRDQADQLSAECPEHPAASQNAELIRVLARVLEGKTIDRAFGAPGDWGYSTPIGAALYAAYGG